MTPKLPKPSAPPPPPTYADARLAAEKVRREPRGSTIMTSGLGDLSEANVARKTLLGE